MSKLGFARPAQPTMVHHPRCPKNNARFLCECGQNVSCSSCGWGSGAWPCRCQRDRMEAARKSA